MVSFKNEAHGDKLLCKTEGNLLLYPDLFLVVKEMTFVFRILGPMKKRSMNQYSIVFSKKKKRNCFCLKKQKKRIRIMSSKKKSEHEDKKTWTTEECFLKLRMYMAMLHNPKSTLKQRRDILDDIVFNGVHSYSPNQHLFFEALISALQAQNNRKAVADIAHLRKTFVTINQNIPRHTHVDNVDFLLPLLATYPGLPPLELKKDTNKESSKKKPTKKTATLTVKKDSEKNKNK